MRENKAELLELLLNARRAEAMGTGGRTPVLNTVITVRTRPYVLPLRDNKLRVSGSLQDSVSSPSLPCFDLVFVPKLQLEINENSSTSEGGLFAFPYR